MSARTRFSLLAQLADGGVPERVGVRAEAGDALDEIDRQRPPWLAGLLIVALLVAGWTLIGDPPPDTTTIEEETR